MFLGRVDKAADELAMRGCGKNVEKVNRHIVTNLSSLYTIQSKSILSRPSILRSEIEEIIRDTYVNDKREKEMATKALGVKVGVDPHALYAGTVQPAGGAVTGSGSRERNKRGRSYKLQQQQHSYPKQTCWGNPGPNPFGTGEQVPAMDCVPTDPRSWVTPPMPPPPVGNPTGWGPSRIQHHGDRRGYVTDATGRVAT